MYASARHGGPPAFGLLSGSTAPCPQTGAPLSCHDRGWLIAPGYAFRAHAPPAGLGDEVMTMAKPTTELGERCPPPPYTRWDQRGKPVLQASLKLPDGTTFRAMLNTDDRKIAMRRMQLIVVLHLSDDHELETINSIFQAIFPGINSSLDDETIKIDLEGEIRRLAKLTLIEYELIRQDAAAELGICIRALDNAVKAARAEHDDTKGQGRPLKLPAIERSETVNCADLLDDIVNTVRGYLVLPEGGAEILTLWAVHTHVFECFGHSPRLALTSPEKRCGKTTTLDVLAELVARPLPTSNATTAAIFRTIEKAKPTLLIDEADTFLKDNEELRGVLNAGHRRGGQIIRTVGDDHEPRQFSTWAPAAIAMIGRLSDTLEDRLVSIALRRRRPTEKVQQFRSERAQDLKQLARKIARWCDDNRHALAGHDPNTGTLVNRSADNWRPLFAVADVAGGRWPEHARTVANASELSKEDQSKRTLLLCDIRDFFAARPEVDRAPSAELAGALGAMENRPWSEWRNSKPITPAALARLLGPFGITPGRLRRSSPRPRQRRP